MGIEFTYCPDCHKKGVWYHLSCYSGEDALKCRYCSWSAFIQVTWNRSDGEEQKRWHSENAKHGIPTRNFGFG
jgi:hypothetical protein